MISERMNARKKRDFDESDRMKDALSAIGIEVWDKSKTWQAMNSKSLGPAGAANPVAAAAAYGYSQQQQQQQQQYGFQPPSQQPAVAVPSRTGSIASAFVAMERPQVAFRMEGNKGSVAEGFAGEDGAPPAKQARLMPEPGAADDAAAAAGGAAVAAADGGGGAAGNGAADAAATAEAVAKPKGSLFVPPSEIDEQNPFADDPEGGPVSADPQPVYGGVEEHLKAQQQQQWDQYQQQQQQANQGAAQPRMYDPTKLKSKICRNIARSGYCAMGYYCTFVHPGEAGYEEKLQEFTAQGGLRGQVHGQEENGKQYVARDVSKTGHDYVRSDDGGVVVDEELVNKLLSQRMQAKFQKDFTSADRVRDQLKALGVHCHDRQKTWKAVPVRQNRY